MNIFPLGGLLFFASLNPGLASLKKITVPSRHSGYEWESSRLRERSSDIFCFHSVSKKESETGGYC